MSYVAPHRYQTRFQANLKKSSHAEFLNNMVRVNQLYNKSQTTHEVDRIHALTEVYTFLQEFQPWKESACLRSAMERKINHLLENEIPTELEDALKWNPNQEKENALYDLEDALLHLQDLMM